MRHYRTAAGAVAAMALVAVSPATASAHDRHGDDDQEPITTVATGLDGPRQLSEYEDGTLVVAESDVGEVSSVDPHSGDVETLLTGAGNAQGVDHQHGRLYVAVGESMTPGEGPSQAVLEVEDGEVVRTFDLLAYEEENNPDGQLQYDEAGQPVDTLSNPFSVLAQEHRLLVSDAGANAVLAIDLHSGEISTFFVPPVVTETPECESAENNPGTVGCDPVPTEITEGPDGLVYVGTLGAEAPGAARVYVLDHHGDVVDVIEDLTSVTGVAVDDDCTVYVSNVIEGAPPMEEGAPPPADFDPATVGDITRISADGSRSTAQVTMPTGLEIEHGELYASAWSVAAFIGLPAGSGEVQRIGDDAFSEG